VVVVGVVFAVVGVSRIFVDEADVVVVRSSSGHAVAVGVSLAFVVVGVAAAVAAVSKLFVVVVVS
jgi:hypothetical protein